MKDTQKESIRKKKILKLNERSIKSDIKSFVNDLKESNNVDWRVSKGILARGQTKNLRMEKRAC